MLTVPITLLNVVEVVTGMLWMSKTDSSVRGFSMINHYPMGVLWTIVKWTRPDMHEPSVLVTNQYTPLEVPMSANLGTSEPSVLTTQSPAEIVTNTGLDVQLLYPNL
jgi:hypothetical protein